MSRNDIGNYLGLAVETVSRHFSRFCDQHLLTVNRRSIQINDLEKLKETAGELLPQSEPTFPVHTR